MTLSGRVVFAASAWLAILLSGCGEREGEDEPRTAGGWSWVRVAGLGNATAVAVHRDDLLFVAGADDHALYVAPLKDVRHAGTLTPRKVPFEVHRQVRLEGRDDGDGFVTHGYQVGDLWDQGVDFQGLATHVTTEGFEFLFVAERAYRVVYRGRINRDPGGKIVSATLQAAFPVVGGKRTGSKGSDWKDHGPGLAGIVSAGGRRVSEDLYVVERESPEPGRFHVFTMDIFGQPLASFTVHPEGDGPCDVGDVSVEGERLLVIRGDGRGSLLSIKDPGSFGLSTPKGSVPGPDVPGAGPWRGLAHDAKGTTYLVSTGPATFLAWR